MPRRQSNKQKFSIKFDDKLKEDKLSVFKKDSEKKVTLQKTSSYEDIQENKNGVALRLG